MTHNIENDSQNEKGKSENGLAGQRPLQSGERHQPKDSRFKKGRSGYPRGRPKKVKVREHDNPAMHHLMMHMKVTGANGKVIEGRFLELFLRRLSSMSLNGNIRAFEKIVELAGGNQAVAFTFMDLYRSERVRDEEPDPEDSNPSSSLPDEETPRAGPATNIGESDLDGPDPDQCDHEGVSPNNRARSSDHKVKNVESRDNKILDEFDAIQRRLTDPNYVSKRSLLARPPDGPGWPRADEAAERGCSSNKAEDEIEYPGRAEFEKGSILYMTKKEIEEWMACPDTEEIIGGEPASSPTVSEHQHDQNSNSQGGEVSSPAGNVKKGRPIVEI